MRHVDSSDGVKVALHDLGGTGPTLLVSHATGFHGRMYRDFASHLTGYHVVAPDLRGHGDTNEATDSNATWYGVGRDLAAVAASLDRPLVAFGHSMGGTGLLMAEHANPRTFAAIVLYEPVIFPDPSPEAAVQFEERLVASALRRRATFPSIEDAIENFSTKPPLKSAPSQVVRDYVEHGFRSMHDGSVTVTCRPSYEADTYRNGSQHHVWSTLPSIDCPVLVLSGNTAHPGPSALAKGHAEHLKHGSFHEFPNLTHFGPMEDGATVAAATMAFLAKY